MTARRVAIGGALGAVITWGLMALAIWIAGGLDKSPLEGPLFFLGLRSIIVTFIALGMVLFIVIEGLVGALVPASAGWVQEEAGLWTGSLVVSPVGALGSAEATGARVRILSCLRAVVMEGRRQAQRLRG